MRTQFRGGFYLAATLAARFNEDMDMFGGFLLVLALVLLILGRRGGG